MRIIQAVLAASMLVPAVSMAIPDEFQLCREAEMMARGIDTENPLGVGYCLGTFQGLRDMALAYKVESGVGFVCVPEKITNIDVVMEFNRQAENYRQFGFRMAAVGFLMNNYPCK